MRVPPVLLTPAVLAVAAAGFAGCDRGTPAILSDEQLLEFRRASLHRQLDSDLVSLSEAFERGDLLISVAATPSLLHLSPEWLWYGTHVSVEPRVALSDAIGDHGQR
jgi:hypothetical protein